MKKNFVSKTPRDVGNGIKVVERKKIKGTEYPIHWHDYYEIQIVTGGHGVHIHNGEKNVYGKGNAWILSYCDCHGFDYKANSFVTSIMFDESMLSPEIAKLITNGIGKYNCVFSDEELKEVIKLAKRLNCELLSDNLLKEAMASALLADIIIRIIRLSDVKSVDTMPSNVQKTVSYIYKNFRTGVTLKEVAAELSVSANYLGEQFKKSMGVTFNTYLNSLRLRYCCNLLVSSDMSIKEVAYSAGYSSVEYFLQVFKKTMDITPTEYRNNIKNSSVEKG